MWENINHSREKFYLANFLTIGLYGTFYIALKAQTIGNLIGKDYPSPRNGLVITIITLTLYPAVMLLVLAYRLSPISYPSLGHTVLALNIASGITAFISGGFFLLISIALWTHSIWLLIDATNNLSAGLPSTREIIISR